MATFDVLPNQNETMNDLRRWSVKWIGLDQINSPTHVPTYYT